MENEHTALTGTTTTITTTKKKKPGSTPLVVVSTFAITLLLGLALLLYTGPPIRRRSSLAGGGGTTRGGAITAASLTLMSNSDNGDNDDGYCAESSGSYVSHRDHCYTYGSGASLNYCWNNHQCPPDCANWQRVASIGDGHCGAPCKTNQGWFRFDRSASVC